MAFCRFYKHLLCYTKVTSTNNPFSTPGSSSTLEESASKLPKDPPEPLKELRDPPESLKTTEHTFLMKLQSSGIGGGDYTAAFSL